MPLIDKYNNPYYGTSNNVNYTNSGIGRATGGSWLTGLIPGLIGAAGSIGSSLIQSSTQRRNVEQQNKARREEAERAHERDIEMWERQNEYNSPAAQQERFREAGLNPHLMYGQGTPGLAQQMPTYNPANLEYSNIPAIQPLEAIQSFIDTERHDQHLKNQRQQLDFNKAQENLTWARSEKVWSEKTVADLEAAIAKAILYKNDHDRRMQVYDWDVINSIAKDRIGGMRATEWLKIATAEIKQWEKGLTDQNISPRDSTNMRMLIDFLKAIGFSPKDIRDGLSGSNEYIRDQYHRNRERFEGQRPWENRNTNRPWER